MVARCLALTFFVFLLAQATIYAADKDREGRDSSLKITDEQLRELTVTEVASDLRSVVYIDSDRDQRPEEHAPEEGTANLRKKNLEFSRRIATLERSLSELEERYRSALRALQLQRYSDRQKDVGARGEVPQHIYLLDSDRDLEMVVLGAGTRAGIRPGLVYRVVRDQRVVARVRVLLVRERIAGAKVLAEGLRDFPGIGDLAVLGQPKN